MADIAPRLVGLSADKLRSLHERLHKSEATPATLEVHHLTTSEMSRRGLEVADDDWAEFEIEIDYLTDVDLSSLSSSLPEGFVEEVIKETGSSIGNVKTVLTILGYALRIDPVDEETSGLEKHLQGKHDQQSHAPNYAKGISNQIIAGEHPSVEPKDVGPLFHGLAKLEEHPDITELKVKGTMLFGDEGLGIARQDMPQIPSKERDRFLSDIEKSDGVTFDQEKIDPKTLKPTQKEISGSRAGKIYDKFKEEGDVPKKERILISNDGYVIDGHHTWAASVALAFDNESARLPVYRLSVDAKEAYDISMKWASDNGFEGQSISASTKKAFARQTLTKHGTHDQSTHGSWAGGAESNISALAPDKTPEAGINPQAIAVATALRNRLIEIEPDITKQMVGLANKVGGTMDGLKDRIKSTGSLADKIEKDSEKDGVTFEEAAGQVSDAVRYTIVFSEKDYAGAALKVDAELRAEGYEPRTKNFWQDGDPYQGINIKATKNGVTAELQLHTQKSLEIKKEIHSIYKVESKTTDPQTKYKLYMREVRYAKRVPYPEDRQLLSSIGVQSFQPFQTPRQAGLTKTTGVNIIETIRGE